MTKIDNFRIMHAAVGTVTTAKLIGDRFTGQKARERDLKIPGLEHPITISGELSDLEMLAEARLSPIYLELPKIVERSTTDPILDIGANIGTTATLFASLYARSTITAFEPFDRRRAVLTRNAARYGARIKVMGAAVTANGGVAFQLNPEAAASNDFCGLRFDGEAIEDAEVVDGHAVPAMTLDEVYREIGSPEQIAVVKLDVEGGERELADHGLAELLAHARCFIVETHDRYRAGATAAVTAAASAAGLELRMQHENDYFFVRL